VRRSTRSKGKETVSGLVSALYNGCKTASRIGGVAPRRVVDEEDDSADDESEDTKEIVAD